MPRESDTYRNNPEFVPEYTYTDRETGITYTIPIAAAVFGINKEFFGVGKVIGSIKDNPVIEVEDHEDGKKYCVMGYESWWAAPIPDEIIEDMASGILAIDSIASYRQAQDDYWELMDRLDTEFLNDNNIDPDL